MLHHVIQRETVNVTRLEKEKQFIFAWIYAVMVFILLKKPRINLWFKFNEIYLNARTIQAAAAVPAVLGARTKQKIEHNRNEWVKRSRMNNGNSGIPTAQLVLMN